MANEQPNELEDMHKAAEHQRQVSEEQRATSEGAAGVCPGRKQTFRCHPLSGWQSAFTRSSKKAYLCPVNARPRVNPLLEAAQAMICERLIERGHKPGTDLIWLARLLVSRAVLVRLMSRLHRKEQM